MKILHRISGATLFEGDFASLRDAVIGAVKAGANLATSRAPTSRTPTGLKDHQRDAHSTGHG